jgi:hypothetical protein
VNVRWRGTKAQLKESLRKISAVLAGKVEDPLGLHGTFWYGVGNGVLAMLSADFRDKLEGGAGRFDGVKWAQLALTTLARKEPRKGYKTTDILAETGQLLASLTPGAGEFPAEVAPDQIFSVRRDGVEVGTADRTADRHQRGTEYMPARPIVPDGAPPPAWEAELERICERALAAVIEKVVEAGPVN